MSQFLLTHHIAIIVSLVGFEVIRCWIMIWNLTSQLKENSETYWNAVSQLHEARGYSTSRSELIAHLYQEIKYLRGDSDEFSEE